MAHEVKDWKNKDCSLSLKIGRLSDREYFSREINEMYGEGGGLNANYTTVEAVAKAANILGCANLKYGKDFIFKTAGVDAIILEFCDKVTKVLAIKTFYYYIRNKII